VIVPVAMEFGSLEGLNKTVGIMRNLKENKGWRGSLGGILPTFYDDVTRETKKIEEDLKAGFSETVLPPIHRATVFRECIAEGQTVFEKAPTSRAAQEYACLVDQVLKW
jgi:chromosome partitioning protein